MKGKGICAIAAVAAFYAALFALGIGCPIKFVTGISCAGCGMTRAWISVLKLDFESAFYYHPLFAMPVLYAAAYFFRKRMGKSLFKKITYIFLIIFLSVYIIRLMSHSTVVVFEPSKNIIFRIFNVR